jgi:CheY-like chemotaxis protein
MPQVIDIEHAADVPIAAIPPSKPVLLVVDDDSGPRQALQIVFGDEFEVVLAENGRQAIQLFRQYAVEVAILDIKMPGMTGIEVLDKLKSIDQDVQVLMLTGFETVETAKQALRLGACDYISKPFNLNELKSSVAAALKRRTFAHTLRAAARKLRELQEEIRCQKVETEIARTKGDIYASIIHDINGPLTVISGFIELINYRLVTADIVENQPLAQVKDHIDHISRQVVGVQPGWDQPGIAGFGRFAPGSPGRAASPVVLFEIAGGRGGSHQRHRFDADFTQPGDQRVAMFGTAAPG